jgi:hypothetical protein
MASANDAVKVANQAVQLTQKNADDANKVAVMVDKLAPTELAHNAMQASQHAMNAAHEAKAAKEHANVAAMAAQNGDESTAANAAQAALQGAGNSAVHTQAAAHAAEAAGVSPVLTQAVAQNAAIRHSQAQEKLSYLWAVFSHFLGRLRQQAPQAGFHHQ